MKLGGKGEGLVQHPKKGREKADLDKQGGDGRNSGPAMREKRGGLDRCTVAVGKNGNETCFQFLGYQVGGVIC